MRPSEVLKNSLSDLRRPLRKQTGSATLTLAGASRRDGPRLIKMVYSLELMCRADA
jgi:hypothetical protein